MSSIRELVINYHMTEACNYRCGFCYAHWNETPDRAELHRRPGATEHLLRLLAEHFLNDNPLRRTSGYTSVRLNFAGGEPILLGKRFQSAIMVAQQLGFRCSVITNGHFIDDLFIEKTAPLLSMVGISFDSADPQIQRDIGRCDRQNRVLSAERLLASLAAIRKINPAAAIKLNTVVNRLNRDDDMNAFIAAATPAKWKLLRVLPVHGDDLTVTHGQFQAYVDRHRQHEARMAVEDNTSMLQSYLMINPQGRFYQNGAARKGYRLSRPIAEVGVAAALGEIDFDPSAFARRYS